MNKNSIKVRLYYPGEIGFEFNCAGFYTMNSDNGGKHLLVNFAWEVPDEMGDFDRSKGAPEAVKSMLFKLEINNRDAERSYGLEARKIEGHQYSQNGIWLSNIENFNIDVTTV